MWRSRNDDVFGVFDDRAEAESTRDELIASGFRPDEVEVRAPNGQNLPFAMEQARPRLWMRGDAALGAGAGGLIGCLLGTLIATGAFSAQPVVLGGGGGAAVIGAVIGLALGALLGGLIGAAVGADRYSFYAREVEAGRTVVIVHRKERVADIAGILQRHGAVRVAAPESLSGHRA